jgi:hypothetical protein
LNNLTTKFTRRYRAQWNNGQKQRFAMSFCYVDCKFSVAMGKNKVINGRGKVDEKDGE